MLSIKRENSQLNLLSFLDPFPYSVWIVLITFCVLVAVSQVSRAESGDFVFNYYFYSSAGALGFLFNRPPNPEVCWNSRMLEQYQQQKISGQNVTGFI